MKTVKTDRLLLHRFKPGCAGSRLYKFFCLLLIFLLQCLPEIQAQQTADYAIKANIIYRFTKYIDWPGNKKTGDFIIGIAGDSPLTDELKNCIVNKKVGAQKMVIKNFSPSAKSYDCHILFIPIDESNSLKKIAARTAGSPILLISESDGLAQKGACINFIILSDHLKLEFNINNIVQRNLNIASELLRLGRIVN